MNAKQVIAILLVIVLIALGVPLARLYEMTRTVSALNAMCHKTPTFNAISVDQVKPGVIAVRGHMNSTNGVGRLHAAVQEIVGNCILFRPTVTYSIECDDSLK